MTIAVSMLLDRHTGLSIFRSNDGSWEAALSLASRTATAKDFSSASAAWAWAEAIWNDWRQQ